MPTRDELFEVTDLAGVPRSESTRVIDSLCEAFGGERVWFPSLPQSEDLAHRNGKIHALWLRGVKTVALAERFSLTQRQIQNILKLFATMN